MAAQAGVDQAAIILRVRARVEDDKLAEAIKAEAARNEAIWDAWAEGERQAYEAYEKMREAERLRAERKEAA